MCAPLPINRFCFPCHADEHNDNRDKREGVEIEFLSNGIKFAEAERAPYRATYTPPQAGLYTLTARIHYGEGHRFIESNTINVVSDLPPTIALTGPANNTVQTAPASFALAATAGSQFGTIAKVEFYSGATLVGTATAGAGNAYSFTWSNVPYGTYSLTAKATDNYGFSSTTAAISVISNAPPSVSITNPADKTVLKTPANNTALTTDAADVDGTIAKVEFYAATTDANGVTTNTLVGTVTQSPYSYQWNAISIGQYVLTAIATDNYGAQTTSSPVALTVKPGELLPYYIHTDHLDTPRQITDTGGNVVWQWDNADPFGNNVPNENPNGQGQFSFPLRFPGQYADRETNLNYNVNRNLEPAIGRYLESDLIGLAGGINTYTYVRGNPLKYVDPKGLEVTMTCRPLSAAPGLPVVHCGVIVWHLDACKHKVIDAQYSLPGGGTSPTTNPQNATRLNDLNAFNNPGGGNINYQIPTPSGMTQKQFDQAVRSSGNSYSAPFYDPTGIVGPNSNSAANQIIQGAGGVAPNAVGAVGQYYWDIDY